VHSGKRMIYFGAFLCESNGQVDRPTNLFAQVIEIYWNISGNSLNVLAC
jgi:hypothetical protein